MRLWRIIKLILRIATVVLISYTVIQFMTNLKHDSGIFVHKNEDPLNINSITREPDLATIRNEPQWTCKLDYNCTEGQSFPRPANETPVSFEELSSRYGYMQLGGSWSPVNCTGPRVAVVIPFRDRHSHLWVFLNNIIPFLQRQKADFRIFLVEQAKPEVFNRAALLNVGFLEASKRKDFDCFIFHDVDLIPEDMCNFYRCTKSPRHLAVAIDKFDYRLPYGYYAGGALAIHRSTVIQLNGFTNIMFGWGGEDDDTYYRFVRHNLHLDRYDDNIARYRMLDHKRDLTNPEAARTSREARYHWKYSSYDGLSSVNYNLTYSTSNKLLTHFSVKLFGPLTLEESNSYFKEKSIKLKKRLLSDVPEKQKVVAVRKRLIQERKLAEKQKRLEKDKNNNALF